MHGIQRAKPFCTVGAKFCSFPSQGIPLVSQEKFFLNEDVVLILILSHLS